MNNSLTIPEYLQNDVYLTRTISERICGVGDRQLRNYVTEDRLQRRYYTQGSKYDLVCYSAMDLLKIAHEKKLPWQLRPDEISQVLNKEDTYAERKNPLRTIDKTTHNKEPHHELPMETRNHEAVLSQIVTPLVTLCDTMNETMARIEAILKTREIPARSKIQTFATISAVFIWACIMVYVAYVSLPTLR